MPFITTTINDKLLQLIVRTVPSSHFQ